MYRKHWFQGYGWSIRNRDSKTSRFRVRFEKKSSKQRGGDYWLTGPIKYCEWNRCEFIFNVTIHTAKTLVFLFKYFKASKMYIVRGEMGIGNNLRVYFEWIFVLFRDTLDVVKQSAALCLLRLFRTDPSVIPSGRFLVFKDGHRKKWRIGRMDIWMSGHWRD